MSKPMVALIGRPNVGKSTFFNYIIGKRLSIVEDIAGVTRDRIYADSNWRGKNFTLIDTGGIESKAEDVIQTGMKEQADIAINIADVVVFIKDMNDFTAMNEVYASFFKEPFPARTTVEVARLPKDVLVEIEAVAYK